MTETTQTEVEAAETQAFQDCEAWAKAELTGYKGQFFKLPFTDCWSGMASTHWEVVADVAEGMRKLCVAADKVLGFTELPDVLLRSTGEDALTRSIAVVKYVKEYRKYVKERAGADFIQQSESASEATGALVNSALFRLWNACINADINAEMLEERGFSEKNSTTAQDVLFFKSYAVRLQSALVFCAGVSQAVMAVIESVPAPEVFKQVN